MATAVQNFLYAVETKNWDMVHDLLPGILSNPDIDKRTVLSAIEELYPTVVEDMLYIKMGKQPPKKSRPTVNDDDSDDDLESGDSTSIPQSMSSAQAKTEEQTEEVTELIKILRWKLDEEEKILMEQNSARVEAQYAEQAAAAGRQLEQQQRLAGEKRGNGDFGGKSRRKRKNKTAKKTKRRKTVKRRKSNKRRR